MRFVKWFFMLLIILMSFNETSAQFGLLKKINPIKKPDVESVEDTIKKFKQIDPTIEKFFKGSAGYAVYPSVRKAGLVAGAAYGEGQAFENNKFIGTTTLNQVSAGMQVGVQVYSEIVFYVDKKELERLKNGNYEFGLQTSYAALKKGAGAEVNMNAKVVAFIYSKGGLMYQATIGGQKFTFKGK